MSTKAHAKGSANRRSASRSVRYNFHVPFTFPEPIIDSEWRVTPEVWQCHSGNYSILISLINKVKEKNIVFTSFAEVKGDYTTFFVFHSSSPVYCRKEDLIFSFEGKPGKEMRQFIKKLNETFPDLQSGWGLWNHHLP